MADFGLLSIGVSGIDDTVITIENQADSLGRRRSGNS